MGEPLPEGVVTFLLSDVVGSTALWESDEAAASAAMARHDALIADVVGSHGGRFVRPRGEGDSTFSAFVSARDAVNAAVAVQRALVSESWPTTDPVRVRMAIHTGEAELRAGDYYGTTVNRTARLRAAAWGGQILCSGATADLVADVLPDDAWLEDLGLHRLRDLARPERIHQLSAKGLPGEFPPPATLDAAGHNLPLSLTRFVGREQELADLRALAETERLVTLHGPGGVGKTRLLVELGRMLVDAASDGVWFCDLSPARTGTPVDGAVATALGVEVGEGDEVAAAVDRWLGSKRVVLLVDNCEQVVADAARFLRDRLAAAPGLRVVTTSRIPLGIAGEVLWHVPPLAVAARPAGPAGDAVALFVDRARAADPRSAPSADDDVVRHICDALDGMPLAIELAAARLRVLSPAQLLERLPDRLKFARSDQDTESRQRSLEATIDWSHDMLGEAERIVFRRLAVFSGGFSVDAVEAVVSGEAIARADVFDVLVQLVDKSLVERDALGVGGRYHLLQTLRAYAHERLVEARELDEARNAHAAYFLDVAADARVGLRGPDMPAWLDRLDIEAGNLRAAAGHLVERGDGGGALALLVGLVGFWSLRGHRDEFVRHLEAALACTPSPHCSADEARALARLALVHGHRGETERAAALAREAMGVALACGDADALVAVATAAMGRLGVSSETEEVLAAANVAARAAGREDLLATLAGLDLLPAVYAAQFETVADRLATAVAAATRAGNPGILATTLLMRASFDAVVPSPDPAADLAEVRRLGEMLADHSLLASVASVEAHRAMSDRDLAGAALSIEEAASHLSAAGDDDEMVRNEARLRLVRARQSGPDALAAALEAEVAALAPVSAHALAVAWRYELAAPLIEAGMEDHARDVLTPIVEGGALPPGDPGLQALKMAALGVLADLALLKADGAQARAWLAALDDVAAATPGWDGEIPRRLGQADVAVVEGDLAGAAADLRFVLDAYASGAPVADCHFELRLTMAEVARAVADHESAARLAGTAGPSIHQASVMCRRRHERLRAHLETTLTPDRLAELSAHGASLDRAGEVEVMAAVVTAAASAGSG